MAKPGRTQKQIAERYKGNLGYYRNLHPWRRARLVVSWLAIFGGLIAVGGAQSPAHLAQAIERAATEIKARIAAE